MSFRVGVIGTGWVAVDRHLPSLVANPEVEIVGFFDHRPHRAAEVSAKFGLRAFPSATALLAEGLDGVSIATSPWSHAEHAIAAMQAGANVFCEKPMAMNTAEAEAMAATARQTGKILTISHNFSYSRAALRAAEFFGPKPELVYASAVQLSSPVRRLPTWYRDLPAGLMFDESPHLLYTLARWCGDLSLVAAHATWNADHTEPEMVEVLLGGAVPARATMVFGAPMSEWHVTLVGRKGVVDLDLFRDIAIRLGPDGAHKAKDIMATSARGLAEHVTGFLGSGALMARGKLRWGHDVLIDAFIAASQGKRTNPVPLEESLSVVRLTAEILETIGATARPASRRPPTTRVR